MKRPIRFRSDLGVGSTLRYDCYDRFPSQMRRYALAMIRPIADDPLGEEQRSGSNNPAIQKFDPAATLLCDMFVVGRDQEAASHGLID